MGILGSIQGENVVVADPEKIQKRLREFITRLQRGSGQCSGNVVFKVNFRRPEGGEKVDSLIEFRSDNNEAWFARAIGVDPWKSFCRALDSLKQIVTEMEMREEGSSETDDVNAT